MGRRAARAARRARPELFRARRLVVDTGLHTKGWTRQQAVDYGISAEEVDRYVVWPGQARAYMIGMLRILELREKAKAELGPRFSLPGFHDMVLGAGVGAAGRAGRDGATPGSGGRGGGWGRTTTAVELQPAGGSPAKKTSRVGNCASARRQSHR